MHDNILSEEQKQLLPFILSFKKEYYMVGGTAVSLQIGHRPRSRRYYQSISNRFGY